MNTYTDKFSVRWVVAPRVGASGLMATLDPTSTRRYHPGPPGGYLVEPPAGAGWRSISAVVDDFANASADNVFLNPSASSSSVPWWVWLGLAWLVTKGK